MSPAQSIALGVVADCLVRRDHSSPTAIVFTLYLSSHHQTKSGAF